MSEPSPLPTVPPSENSAKPGDGAGPTRLRASLQAGKRGAYKCRKCGVKHGEGAACGAPGAAPGNSPAAPSAPIPQVFTPENTGRLLRAPFTIAAVRTNCRIWLLDPKEEAELVATAVPCANEWVKVEPKWAALFMFSYSLVGVAVGKALDYAAWRRQMMEELAAEARAAKAAQAAQQPEPQRNAAPGVLPATPPPSAPSVS